MRNDKIKLIYNHKEPKEKILKTPVTATLKPIKTFGNPTLDKWENILIFGDNFKALKLLLQNPLIKGKVKSIYIDPPFSTNQIYKAGHDRTATVSKSRNDTNAYEDTLLGPEYLEFLRKRLLLLHEVLSDSGSIYVHIDWKMGHYVKVLMDEIFGPHRFINDITRVKCNPKNFQRKSFGNVKDMILFYSKTNNYLWRNSTEELTQEDIKKLFPKIDNDGRNYATTPLHAPGETKNGPTGQPWKGKSPPQGRHWRVSPHELEKLDKAGLIEWSSTGNPRKKIYADEILTKGKKRQDIWEFKDPSYPSYPTQKNLEMLQTIIEASSNLDDIVLDCFAGSGTTLVAAEQTGRRWIGIDNSKVAIQITQQRLKAEKEYSPFSLYEILEPKHNE